jgi:hypothetical protein
MWPESDVSPVPARQGCTTSVDVSPSRLLPPRHAAPTARRSARRPPYSPNGVDAEPDCSEVAATARQHRFVPRRGVGGAGSAIPHRGILPDVAEKRLPTLTGNTSHPPVSGRGAGSAGVTMMVHESGNAAPALLLADELSRQGALVLRRHRPVPLGPSRPGGDLARGAATGPGRPRFRGQARRVQLTWAISALCRAPPSPRATPSPGHGRVPNSASRSSAHATTCRSLNSTRPSAALQVLARLGGRMTR